MADKKTPIPADVQALMRAGIPQHKAVSYAGLNAPAEPKRGK